jgi:hypothetical protein
VDTVPGAVTGGSVGTGTLTVAVVTGVVTSTVVLGTVTGTVGTVTGTVATGVVTVVVVGTPTVTVVRGVDSVTVGSPKAPGWLPAGTLAAKKPKPATAAQASRITARRVTERSKPNSIFDVPLPQSSLPF